MLIKASLWLVITSICLYMIGLLDSLLDSLENVVLLNFHDSDEQLDLNITSHRPNK